MSGKGRVRLVSGNAGAEDRGVTSSRQGEPCEPNHYRRVRGLYTDRPHRKYKPERPVEHIPQKCTRLEQAGRRYAEHPNAMTLGLVLFGVKGQQQHSVSGMFETLGKLYEGQSWQIDRPTFIWTIYQKYSGMREAVFRWDNPDGDSDLARTIALVTSTGGKRSRRIATPVRVKAYRIISAASNGTWTGRDRITSMDEVNAGSPDASIYGHEFLRAAWTDALEICRMYNEA